MLIYYSIATIITFITLLIMIFTFENKKLNIYFLVICLIMTIANGGYIALAVSENVGEALLANKLSYLGGCFVPPITLLLGCTTAAEEIFPDLKYCIVDKKIDHIESLSLINEWIDRYSDKIEEEFYYEKGDKHFECKIKRIWNKNKAHGYIFEICEDTDKGNILSLLKIIMLNLKRNRLSFLKK